MENRKHQWLNWSSATEDPKAEKHKEENNLQVTQNPQANIFILVNHDKNHDQFSIASAYTVHGF